MVGRCLKYYLLILYIKELVLFRCIVPYLNTKSNVFMFKICDAVNKEKQKSQL